VSEAKRLDYQIVIPVYNGADILEGTLREIEKLDYLDVCIFIDDASRDRTAEILREWEWRLAGVYYLKKNGQKIGAVKKVLEEMRRQSKLPKYIVLSDVDTFFFNHNSKQALQDAIKFMEEKGWMAVGLMDIPYKNYSFIQKCQYWEYLCDRAMHNILSRKGYMRCIPGAGGIYSSLCLLEALQHHSLRHAGDDMETTCLVQKLGYSVGYYNRDLEARTRVPYSWRGLIKQRIRWTVGAIETYIKEWRFYFKQVLSVNRYGWQVLYETLKLVTYVGWYWALFVRPVFTFIIGWIATFILTWGFTMVNPESKGQRLKATLWLIPTSWIIYLTDIVRLPIAYVKTISNYVRRKKSEAYVPEHALGIYTPKHIK